MAPLPLITVIITTYNYAHTVGVAIDSALAQDYPELEVLVVDNCSTDATPELVERYRADPRFRYIRNESNIGMVPNHNKGLREARGAYVLFLSADDFLLPGHISRSYWYLHEHPDIDVLYASTLFVEESGRFIGVRQMGGQPMTVVVTAEDLLIWKSPNRRFALLKDKRFFSLGSWAEMEKANNPALEELLGVETKIN